MTDHELVGRYATDGDQEAFRAMVDRHAGMVYGVALRRTTEPALAEEVAQTVFVQLARKAGSLKDPGRLSGWLHRCAVLESSHIMRKRRREQAHQRELAQAVATPEAEDHSSDYLAAFIDEALHELAPPDREIILAKYYEGLTYREIAERSARKEAATRKQGSRALEKLERLLCRKGLVITSTALAGGLDQTLRAVSPMGLPDAIEGRVANLTGGGHGFSWAGALGSVLGSGIGLTVVAAVMALVPLTFGWGRKVTPLPRTTSNQESVSLLGSRQAATTVEPGQIPTIEEILQATGTQRLSLLIPWLAAANVEDMQAMAQALDTDLHEYARASSFELFASLYFQRGFTLDSEWTLALAGRWRAEDAFVRNTLTDEKLFQWWAQVDSESAWANARSRSVKLAGSVIQSTLERDPWQAHRWVASLAPEEANSVVSWKDLFGRLAKQSVPRALDLAKELTNPLAKQEALRAVLGEEAKAFPENAMDHAGTISNTSIRENVMEAIARQWLQTDRTAAWEVIEKMEPSLKKLALVKQAGLAWARQSPEEAAAWAETLTDPSLKRAAWIGLAVAFSKTDVQRARHAFEQLGGQFQDLEQRRIYVSGGSSGYGLRGEDSLEAATKAVTMALAETDMREAIAFVETFSSLHKHIGYDLAKQWVRRDPEGMAAYIREAPDSQMKSYLTSRYADEVEDPIAALTWARELDGRAGESAFRTLFRRLGESDFDRGINALSEIENLTPKDQNSALSALLDLSVGRRTLEELNHAKAWIEAEPEPEAFSQAYRELTTQMAYSDEAQAISLVDDLDTGPARQEAIGGLLGFLGNQSPMQHEKVLHWIGQSESERTQQFWLKILAKDWLGKDPDTAKRVIPKAGLNKEDWERLLSREEQSSLAP